VSQRVFATLWYFFWKFSAEQLSQPGCRFVLMDSMKSGVILSMLMVPLCMRQPWNLASFDQFHLAMCLGALMALGILCDMR
jgi:hypothetical protein